MNSLADCVLERTHGDLPVLTTVSLLVYATQYRHQNATRIIVKHTVQGWVRRPWEGSRRRTIIEALYDDNFMNLVCEFYVYEVSNSSLIII